MGYLLVILLVVVVIAATLFGLPLARAARWKRMASAPFPREWEETLQRNVSLYRHLPASVREQLLGAILVFLGEKRFEGCGGLVITDEIRVTIAAEACLLLLNGPARFYPRLRSILVYPDAYVAPHYTLGRLQRNQPRRVLRRRNRTFFERPRHRKREEPDLYEVLKDFYLVDPAEWEQSGPQEEARA